MLTYLATVARGAAQKFEVRVVKANGRSGGRRACGCRLFVMWF